MSFANLPLDLPPVPIAGPKQLPIVGVPGNLFRFFRDPVGWALRLYREYGELAAVNDRSPVLILAFGANYNREVLANPNLFLNFDELPFPVPRDSAAQRLMMGLQCMNGDTHKAQRRLLMPVFHKAVNEGYRDTIVSITERRLARWRIGAQLDMAAEMLELSKQIALECLFGLKDAHQGEQLSHLVERFMQGVFSVRLMAFPYSFPGSPYKHFMATAGQLEGMFQRLIQQKQEQGQSTTDVLSLLMGGQKEGAPMTDGELLGQAATFFVAGHETTANTLSWTLFLLSQHPQILADLTDELTGLLGGAPPTMQQLAQLPLLDGVFKESMRLLPALPLLFPRITAEPAALGPYTLPKGARVLVSPLVTHRQPALFPEPQRFRPERWAKLQPSAYEYIPFSAGPRMCIGAGFAAMTVRLVLATVLQKFRLGLAPAARISRHVRSSFMAPKYGLPMSVHGPDARLQRQDRVRGDIHELVSWS